LDPPANKDVFILQSMSPPINDHLIELLLLISAAKRAGCKSVTAVIPYLGYSRDIFPETPGAAVPSVGSTVAKLVKRIIITILATKSGRESCDWD